MTTSPEIQPLSDPKSLFPLDERISTAEQREDKGLARLEELLTEVEGEVDNPSEKQNTLRDINEVLGLYNRPAEIGQKLAALNRREEALNEQLQERPLPRDNSMSPPSSLDVLSELGRQDIVDEVDSIEAERTALIAERASVHSQLDDQESMVERIEATITGAERVLNVDAVDETTAAGDSRSLTDGEIALAREVFGDEIDYNEVQMFHKSFFPFGMQPDNRPIAPAGDIYFDPAGVKFRDDFSISDDRSRALFIHEMTHVWQHQQGINVAQRGVFDRQYDYEITQGKSLEHYGIEQQADIVRDYFRIKEGLISEGAALADSNGPPARTTTTPPPTTTTTPADEEFADINDYLNAIPFSVA